MIITNGPPSPAAGIDGPAAFLASEAPDLGMNIQILSVSQTQCQNQLQQSLSLSQSRSPTGVERDGDTETLLEPKTDIHELLQKQGESRQEFDEKKAFVKGARCPAVPHPIIRPFRVCR